MAAPAVSIDHLTVEERLELLERLWDSLVDTPERIPLTDAQREELDRRLDDFERDPSIGIPWDEVRKRIQGQLE
jgi:putative addiction module component (TIGR02574 family)